MDCPGNGCVVFCIRTKNTDSFGFPKESKAGDEIKLNLAIDNVGVAPLYDKVSLKVKLIGDDSYEFDCDADVNNWLPGKHVEEITIKLPCDIKSGEYHIGIGITGVNYPMVYFATDAKREGAYYLVGKTEIK